MKKVSPRYQAPGQLHITGIGLQSGLGTARAVEGPGARLQRGQGIGLGDRAGEFSRTALLKMQCMTRIMTPCRVVKMQNSHSTT